MALYEERDRLVRGAVLDFLESHSRALENPQKNTVVTHSHVEVGIDHYEFYYKVA